MSQKRKRSLLKTFARAAMKVALGVGLVYGTYVGAFYAGRGEPLTQREAEAVTNIFGDEVNVSKIRKHFKSNGHITHIMRSKQGTVMPLLSHIDFFGDSIVSKDYGAEGSYRYGFFLHEATHVWQNQNWNWSLKNFRVYEYTLTPGARFQDFGLEQQAEIIEAYARRWHHPEGRQNARPENAAADQMLQQVVENRFPRAKQTRLARERQAKTGPKVS